MPHPVQHIPACIVIQCVQANNCTALRAGLRQAFLPLLGGDRMLTGAPGRIVNVSSVEGKYGAPFMGAYAASKHAMEGMSDSLRRELMLYGIDVIVVGEQLNCHDKHTQGNIIPAACVQALLDMQASHFVHATSRYSHAAQFADHASRTCCKVQPYRD